MANKYNTMQYNYKMEDKKTPSSTHLHWRQSIMKENMLSFRLTSYALHQSTAIFLPLKYFYSRQMEMVFDHLVVMLHPVSYRQRTPNAKYEM